MIYLVTYDIEIDRVRDRVARLLSRYGQRVQDSVFECAMDERELEILVGELRKNLADDPEADVRLYRLCVTCFAAARGIGAIRRSDLSTRCIIV
jgi:CRISPR-associated protein Cas2